MDDLRFYRLWDIQLVDERGCPGFLVMSLYYSGGGIDRAMGVQEGLGGEDSPNFGKESDLRSIFTERFFPAVTFSLIKHLEVALKSVC